MPTIVEFPTVVQDMVATFGDGFDTDGKSERAWLFPAEAWQTLSLLMKRAQELPFDKREVLGQANAQYVVEHYALEKWVEKLGEIYHTLLKAEYLYG